MDAARNLSASYLGLRGALQVPYRAAGFLFTNREKKKGKKEKNPSSSSIIRSPIYPSSPLFLFLSPLPLPLPLPPPSSPARPPLPPDPPGAPASSSKKEKMEKFFAAKAKGSTQADPTRKVGEGEEEGHGQGNRKPLFPKGVVLGKDGKP